MWGQGLELHDDNPGAPQGAFPSPPSRLWATESEAHGLCQLRAGNFGAFGYDRFIDSSPQDSPPFVPNRSQQPDTDPLASQAEFFQHLSLGMARVSLTGRFELVNDEWCRMLGRTHADFEQLTPRDITHPEDHSASTVYSELCRTLAPGQPPPSLEKRFLRPDGSILFARVTVKFVFDDEGQPLHKLIQLAEIEDVWRRTRLDEAHRRVLDILTRGGSLDEVLEEIVRNIEAVDPGMRSIIKTVDPMGLCFSRVIAPGYGDSTQKMLLGMPIEPGATTCSTAILERRRVIASDMRTHPDWQDALEVLEESGAIASICEPVLDSQGAVCAVFTLVAHEVWSPSPIDLAFCEDVARLVGLAIERYQTLEALRLSRARFDAMLENAPEAVMLIDHEGQRFVEVNERAGEILGMDAESLLTADPWAFFPEEQPDGQSTRELVHGLISLVRKVGPQTFSITLQDATGKQFATEVHLSRLPTASGTIYRAEVRDLQDRLRAAAELQASEAQRRAILESIDDALIATDPRGLITHFNAVAERMTGNHEALAIGRHVDDVLELRRLDDQAPVTCPLESVLRDEHVIETEEELVLCAEDGSDVFVSQRAAPIRGSHGRVEGMVLVLRDVTATRAAQERSLQARKLEAIGQLAGGVAHDFNNLLTSILGNAELLCNDSNPEVERIAARIALAARRSADVTGQLLRFSRKETVVRVQLDVHALIKEVVELFRPSLEQRIDVELELEAQQAAVLGQAGQLQNALLNLCLNARDAIAARTEDNPQGCIRIGTENPIDAPTQLRLTVEDNGTGIAEDVRGHIFEPFFTTKLQGTGTGLGLASAYGTVRAMGGTIQVQSEVGAGTRFMLDLPLVEGAEEQVELVPARADGGQRNVLVVDDEELVREFIIRALATHGFTTMSAANGREAEELYRTHRFDLVVLDMVMPGRGGAETFRALTKLDPAVRVLFASGFDRDGRAQDLLTEGAAGYIEKPFQIQALIKAVRRALATKQPRTTSDA